MALATSATSARVGRGLRIIESSICVAVMTGLYALLHLRMMVFWMWGTWAAGTSTPRSPRATMMPSEASRISSKFLTPSALSILGKIWTCGAPISTQMSRICLTAAPSRMKDAAMASMPSSQPNMMSARSWSVTEGRPMFTLGTLTPFFSPISPPLVTTQWMSEPSTWSTSRPTRPSSMRRMEPFSTSLGRLR